MKLFVRSNLKFGKHETIAINIEQNQLIIDLKIIIQEKYNIPKEKQILKFKRDGFTIRLVDSWNFDFYGIVEKSVIYFESVEVSDEQVQAHRNKNMNHRYLQKLGYQKKYSGDQLSKMIDEAQQLAQNNIYMYTPENSPLLQSLNNKQSQESQNLEISLIKQSSNEKSKKVENCLEGFLRETKNGNISLIQNILDEYEFQQNKKDQNGKNNLNSNLIDQIGSQGWSALHFAVYQGNLQMVKEFLSRKINCNQTTDDGWSPLQLSIYKNHFEVFKSIIKVPNLNINLLTPKGTGLHIACKQAKLNMVQLLLQKKADVWCKDQNGYTADDLCQSPDIIKLISQQKNQQQQFQIQTQPSQRPVKPQKIIGYLYRITRYYMKRAKYFYLIDPNQGTLIMYNSKDDFPIKPKKIIPLSQIFSVTKYSNEWFMKNNLCYFELQYTQKMIFACKNVSTMNIWIDSLVQSSIYSHYMDDYFKVQNLDEIIDSAQSNQLEKPIEVIDDVEKQNNVARLLCDLQYEKKEKIIISEQEQFLNLERKKQKEIILESPVINIVEKNIKQKKENDYDKIPDLDINQPSSLNQSATFINKVILQQKVNLKSFQIIRVLGAGAFGKVYLVKKIDSGEIFAMKVIKKLLLIQKNLIPYAIGESKVLQQCGDHPFVLTLHYSFQTQNNLYFILDYCGGGELSLHLIQRESFDEQIVKFLIGELILAIECLHSKDILYRDLKPENILLQNDGHICLVDFGLCKQGIDNENYAYSFCGSPAYLTPEMLQKQGASKAADFYSIGTVMFEFLTGETPFYCDNVQKMYEKIKGGKIQYPKNMDPIAKDLLKQLLNKDINQRLQNFKDLKSHKFFEGIDWDFLLAKKYEAPIQDFDQEDEYRPERVKFTDIDYTNKNYDKTYIQEFDFNKYDN